MLGRRYFRIKVFQTLYGWFLGGETRPEVAERNLLQSIDKIYELYFLQFSFLLEVMNYYEVKMEDAKHKFYPTEEELNPSQKLINNLVIRQIRENKELQDNIKAYKISWTEEQEMVRKVYQKMRNSKDLKEYLNSDSSSYKEDSDALYRLIKKFIVKSGELQYYCEERSIFWTDDYHSVSLLLLKTIKLLTENFSENVSFTNLFSKEDEETDPADDRKFMVDLFRRTISDCDDYDKLIEAKTRNWELDRIALTDIIMIKMALTELICFPTIPIKVTLNEYIEMSKLFSTPKSKLFINGILDKLVEELQAEGRIRKTGRGLMT
jgi:transcription antitermination protein NusB